MKIRPLATASAAVLALSPPASAQLTTTDYFTNDQWTVSQQFIAGRFDSCMAHKNFLDNGVGLTIGRAITGEDYIIVNRIAKLLGPGEETLASGSVSFDGKAENPFKDQTVSPSSTVPGEKYITVYMSSSFTEDFAKAFNVQINFANGSSKHPLKGSKLVINKLDECTDNALATETVVNTRPVTPAGWTAGTSEDGSALIYVKLPTPDGTPKGVEYWMAYVKKGNGSYDIRFRDSSAALSKAINLSSGAVTRDPFAIKVNDKGAFKTLVSYEKTAVDIVDVLPGDLLKLGQQGTVTFTNLDPEKNQEIAFEFSNEVAAAAEALVSGGGSGSGEVTLQGLVGRYYVRGRNPNGKLYFGKATTELDGNTLKIEWVWTNEKKESGTATLFGNVVTGIVPGYNAPTVYKVGKDGVWRGTWDDGRATEVWVPIP